MSFSDGFALAIAMIILALVPGPAVFAVIAKAMSNGFKHGLAISAGIVVGDFAFILLAVFLVLRLLLSSWVASLQSLNIWVLFI